MRKRLRRLRRPVPFLLTLLIIVGALSSSSTAPFRMDATTVVASMVPFAAEAFAFHHVAPPTAPFNRAAPLTQRRRRGRSSSSTNTIVMHSTPNDNLGDDERGGAGGGGDLSDEMSSLLAGLYGLSATDETSSSASPSSTEDAYDRYTHQIAIPLETNHDLLSSLRDVQRSVLYHCPVLIRASIMPVTTRMPLLYVDASTTSSSSVLGGGGGGGSREDPTTVIQRTIQEVVRDLVFVPTDDASEETSGSTADQEQKLDGANIDGVTPILLPFQGLELDGPTNDVLYAIGSSECHGAALLRQVVKEIRTRLEVERGWSTALPEDAPQGDELVYDETDEVSSAAAGEGEEEEKEWRPRAPFMRLPPDFYVNLPQPTGDSPIRGARSPEEGGDGISPLFWYPWVDDTFGTTDPGIRMKSIGVYPRTFPRGGASETSFYAPKVKVALPEGNKALREAERRIKEDAEGTWGDDDDRVERTMWDENEREGEVVRGGGMREEEGDGEVTLADADREALERIYATSSETDEDVDEDVVVVVSPQTDAEANKADEAKVDVSVDEAVLEPKARTEAEEILSSSTDEEAFPTADQDDVDDNSPPPPPNDDGSYTRDVTGAVRSTTSATAASSATDAIVQKYASARSARRQSNGSGENALPSIEDNPVFKRFHEGKLSSVQAADEPLQSAKPLPPYPSDEHFVGIWRLVSSPVTSPDNEGYGYDGAGGMMMGGDPSSSDNFILRVDKTIMGGPVLDAANNHKAAGGSWNMFQAVWVGEGKNDDGADATATRAQQTRLRLRLLVPPAKTRVMVLEGEVTRVLLPGQDASDFGGGGGPDGGDLDGVGGGLENRFAPTTFGIPEAEAVRKAAAARRGDDGMLHCGGEAWLEDADGGGNRRKLGRFSLMKLKTPERSQLRYTVPAPRGNPETEME